MTAALTRLHITPLDPGLLDSILGPNTRPLATDISFHTIPTFPENNYGYISLPSMEADKLKKKLNGSILKGRKFKVEAARPDPKETRRTLESSDTEKKEKKKSSKRKATEHEDGVLEGHELPADRHVKRGWTEPASSKKHKKQKKGEKEPKSGKVQPKSKYTEKPECLFKTKTPPNKTVADKKDKKRKAGKAPNEVIVHEFAQTVTHPSFLKSTTQEQPVTAAFVEGKGWVDRNGEVKEPASEKVRKACFKPGKKDGAKEHVSKTSKHESKSRKAKQPTPTPSSSESEEESDWTSSSGSSDDDSSVSESDIDSDECTSDDENSISKGENLVTEAEPQSPNKSSHEDELNFKNNGKTKDHSASDKIDGSEDSDLVTDEDTSSENGSEDSSSSSSHDDAEEKKADTVHPLEALFKRPQSTEQKPEESNAGFSFFGGNDDDIEEEDEDEVHIPLPTEPLTPYTKRDLMVRGVRSAAPTPDTAIRNHTRLPVDQDGDMEDADEHSYLHHTDSSPSKPRDQSAGQQPQETDFAKWFWENRGDNNRAWKKRRREAAKEKRQRENRRRGLKGRG